MAKAKGLQPQPLPPVKVPNRLKHLENEVGVEGLASVFEFAGSVFQAINKSLENGKIDPLDAMYLIEPLTKVTDMVQGLPKIKAELYDELTDEELHYLLGILLKYGIVPEDLEEAFEDHLRWARDTKALLFKYYIKG
jgi:hypothetical protein